MMFRYPNNFNFCNDFNDCCDNDSCRGPQSPRGCPGSVGPMGPRGPMGAPGLMGPEGKQGPIGPQGPQGMIGPTGAAGPQGVPGPQGAVGPQGIPGPQGAPGPTGATGPQGVPGPAGPAGPQGPAVALNVNTSANVSAQLPAAANSAILFDTTQTTAGTAITYTQGTGIFTLNQGGIYQISYNAVATNRAEVTPPALVGVHLTRDSVAIAGTESRATIIGATNAVALSGTTTVQVITPPVNITLAASNTNGVFSDASITIRKLD